MGYGTRALDALMVHPDFKVAYFWTPQSRLCDDVWKAAKRWQDQVSLTIIKNRDDLLEHVKAVDDVRCFVMNASPIILTEPILERMDFFNIHPGNLAGNRGHHPHLWSILLDEKETQINLHTVTPQIDLGKIIDSITVPVLPDDTSLRLLNRAEDHIGELLTTLAKYLRGECREKSVITSGGYRRKMTYEDYRIRPESDTVKDMDRKIRTRAMHSGAFFALDGKRYYVNRILDQPEHDTENKRESGTPILPAISEQEGILTFCRGTETIRFQESKITDQEGNVIWKCPDGERDNVAETGG